MISLKKLRVLLYRNSLLFVVTVTVFVVFGYHFLKWIWGNDTIIGAFLAVMAGGLTTWYQGEQKKKEQRQSQDFLFSILLQEAENIIAMYSNIQNTLSDIEDGDILLHNIKCPSTLFDFYNKNLNSVYLICDKDKLQKLTHFFTVAKLFSDRCDVYAEAVAEANKAEDIYNMCHGQEARYYYTERKRLIDAQAVRLTNALKEHIKYVLDAYADLMEIK